MMKFYTESEVVMMLRRYVTDIFDPVSGEISHMGDVALASVMKRTYFMRTLLRFRSRLMEVNVRCVAGIAVLLAACSVLVVNQSLHVESARTDAERHKPFRGVSGSGVAATGSEFKNNDPIAYLVDVSGEVAILKDGKKQSVKSSCELLNSGDELEFSSGANGKVIYEDAVYNVSGPVRYRIVLPDPLKVQGSGGDDPVEPQFTTRGTHLGMGNVEHYTISPATMLAQVIPPTTRAGDAEVVVCSPRGACYNVCPIISITGVSGARYSVSAADVERVRMGGSVEMNGSSQTSGKGLFEKTPEEEEVYSIIVSRDGKTVNEVSVSTFWLLSIEDRKRISKALLPVESLESDTAKDFFTANVLYANGCHSEAYLLSKKLCAKESNNGLYLKLMKLCAKALNLKF